MPEFSDRVITVFEANITDVINKLNQMSRAMGTTRGAIAGAGSAAGQSNRAIAGTAAATGRLSDRFGDVASQSDVFADRLKEVTSWTGNVSSSFRRSTQMLGTGIPLLDSLSIRFDRASMAMWKFTMASIPLRGVFTSFAVGLGLAVMGIKKFAEESTLIESSTRAFAAMTGSVQKAGEMVEYLRKQAPKIRYSLSEVIEAGRVIAVAGYDIQKLIYPMADLAAGINQQGVDIASASRAFVDAMHGEFRRLRNTFDITKEEVRKFAGDAINAQGQVVDKTRMQVALIQAIQAKYGGANKAMMDTLIGYVSNLGDNLKRMFAAIGDTIMPTIKGYISWLAKTVEKTTAWIEKNKTLVSWLVRMSAGFLAVSTAITGFLFVGVQAIGIFSSLLIFVKSYKGEANELIVAQMKMSAIMQELATIEAARLEAELPMVYEKVRAMQAELGISSQLLGVETQRAGVVGGAATAGGTQFFGQGRQARPGAFGGPAAATGAAAAEAMHNARIARTAINPLEEAYNIAMQQRIAAEEAATAATTNAARIQSMLTGNIELTTTGRIQTERALAAAQAQAAVATEAAAAAIAEETAAAHALAVGEAQLSAAMELESAARAAAAASAAARQVAEAAMPGARFAAGFAGSAGKTADMLMKMTGISQIAKMLEGLAKVSGGSLLSNLAGFAGGLLGVIAPLAILAAVVGGVILVMNYSKKVQADQTEAIKENLAKIKEWTQMFDVPVAVEEATTKLSDAIDKLSGLKEAAVGGKIHPGSELLKQGVGLEETRFIMAQILKSQPGLFIQDKNQPPLTVEAIMKMGPEELKQLKIAGGEFAANLGGMVTDLERMMGSISDLAAGAEKNADAWLDTKLATKDIDPELRKYYETTKASGRSAFEVAKIISRQIDDREKEFETAQEVEDSVDKRLKKEQDVDAVIGDASVELLRQRQLLEQQVKDNQILFGIAPKMAKAQQEKIDKIREELDLTEKILKLKKTENDLAKIQQRAEWFAAGGAKFGGAVFGPETVAAEVRAAAEAAAAKDGEKYSEHMINARKAWAEMVDDNLEIRSMMAEVGPNATEMDKYFAAGEKAAIEAERYKSREAYWAVTIAGLTNKEQKARAGLAQEAELYSIALAEAKAAQEAATILANYQLAMMKARRDLLETEGYSAYQLYNTDLAILETERARAAAEGRTTDEIEKRIEMMKTEKAAANDMLGAAESRLGLLQAMGERGLIAPEVVEDQKKRMAAAYAFMASKAKAGTAEQYSLMQKSIDALASDTEDKWDGIIGRIIGAPDELVKDLISEGRLAARFGDVAGTFGPSGNIAADIVSQNRKEVVYRVKFDLPFAEVDRRVADGMGRGIEAFAKELVGALK